MKDYCVILSSYQNTPEKVDFVLQTLDYFDKMEVDVCFTTHAALGLDEISKKTKWSIYDSINEFMEPSDWVNNIDLINDWNSVWGKSTLWRTYSFFNIITNFGSDFSPHLRSCFSLFANAVRTIYDHGYKWFVYLEYDVAPPSGGYCRWIEEKLDLLKSTNSNTFYYKKEEETGGWPVGFFFISKPDIFIEHPNFKDTSWKYSKRDWVRSFQRAFFETAIKGILDTSPIPVSLQIEYLSKEAIDLWGVEDYGSWPVNMFNYNSVHKRKDGGFYCCLLPCVQNGEELYVFWENTTTQEIQVEFVRIEDDEKHSILDTGQFTQQGQNWYINKISTDNISGKKLYLQVGYNYLDTFYEYQEVFDMEYFHQIHELLRRVIFN